ATHSYDARDAEELYVAVIAKKQLHMIRQATAQALFLLRWALLLMGVDSSEAGTPPIRYGPSYFFITFFPSQWSEEVKRERE
ncbi:hypothetical protein WUBG_06719, partial [Wuchereria bancrofti]